MQKEEEETVNKSPANSILFVEVDNNTNAAVYMKGLLMLFLFKNWVERRFYLVTLAFHSCQQILIHIANSNIMKLRRLIPDTDIDHRVVNKPFRSGSETGNASPFPDGV